MKLNKLITVAFMIAVTLTGVVLTSNQIAKSKITEVYSKRDPTFTEFAFNKQIATSSLDILTIHDKESYLEVKDKLFYKLSDALKRETFLKEEYTGLTLPEPTLGIKTISGDMSNKENDVYIFKVDLFLAYEGTSAKTDITMLISVSNGLVYNMERI